MKYWLFNDSYHGIEVRISSFAPECGGVQEYNAVLRHLRSGRPFEEQIVHLQQALEETLRELPPGTCIAFMRYFLSDPANQVMKIPPIHECAQSVIGQAPLDGSKVALWVYMLTDMEAVEVGDNMYALHHGYRPYRHLWSAGASYPYAPQYTTESLLHDYSTCLRRMGGSLEESCQRTWFFVRDVDVNYAGMVEGRNRVFDQEGLTSRSHFIASTGICGINADPQVTVTMDAYSVLGIDPDQITYLKAREYLNPTTEYGVAFERGTAIVYGDRRHLLISGTASIDKYGYVVHPGHIEWQTRRMLENVRALVTEGGCSMADLTHLIIYLRDISDYGLVNHIFEHEFPRVPKVIVHAPVCRPGWLIEVECMAIGANGDSRFDAL